MGSLVLPQNRRWFSGKIKTMGGPGSTVVLFKDDSKKEVFLVFRSDYPIWGTTGGAIEPGETPEEATLREAYEETGFTVKVVRYVGLYRRKTANVEYKSYLFEGRVVSGKFRPEFPGCRGKWFSVDRLPLSIMDRTKEKIFDCIKHKSGEFEKEYRRLTLKNNFHLLLLHLIAAAKYIILNFKKETR